jgi:hypothetical protein
MEKEAKDKGADSTGGKQASPRGRGGKRRNRTRVGQKKSKRAGNGKGSEGQGCSLLRRKAGEHTG